MADRAQHTLYQVSTATALVEGIYQGAVQIAALREHGDLGLLSQSRQSAPERSARRPIPSLQCNSGCWRMASAFRMKLPSATTSSCTFNPSRTE